MSPCEPATNLFVDQDEIFKVKQFLGVPRFLRDGYDSRLREMTLSLIQAAQLFEANSMRILLTNDDGFYAPGIAALHNALIPLGDVLRIAPATEQSGVGHSITFLTPLIAHPAADSDGTHGWKVEGSPADCVKLGISELAPWKPDIVVSGINGGLNAGINVLYSGTVAGAIEGAFFGIDSVAVSLEFEPEADFDAAAKIAVSVISGILKQQGNPSKESSADESAKGRLYNLNIPTAALTNPQPEISVVPMGTNRYGEDYIKRTDPKGRDYYWATNDPPPQPTEHLTDLSALAMGNVTLTPLSYDMTARAALQAMQHWHLKASDSNHSQNNE